MWITAHALFSIHFEVKDDKSIKTKNNNQKT